MEDREKHTFEVTAESHPSLFAALDRFAFQRGVGGYDSYSVPNYWVAVLGVVDAALVLLTPQEFTMIVDRDDAATLEIMSRSADLNLTVALLDSFQGDWDLPAGIAT